MNVFDGSLSDVEAEESQATQLIHAALEKSPEHSEGQSRSGFSASNKDNSIESYPSSKDSSASSVHQYHFHGLAATQTQTQVDEEDSANVVLSEGSQKENIGTAGGGKNGKDVKWGMPSPDSQPSSPHGLVVRDNVTVGGQSGTPGRVMKPQISTVTFQSPTKNFMSPSKTHAKLVAQPTKAKGKHNLTPKRNGRSRSPDFSQDSFAQADSQLLEEKFLMTSKKFTTPLVDLARVTEEDGYSGNLSMRTQGYSSRTAQHAPEDDNNSPVILVPSTPSQSGSSDHSRESSRGRPPSLPLRDDSFEQAQTSGRTVHDIDSGKGSQHSQGYDGQDEVAEVQDLYSNRRETQREPALHPVVYPVSPSHAYGYQAAQQATQIATQEDSVPVTLNTTPQTNTSMRTGPRSLLSTMDSNKRGRYQHLVQHTPALPVSPLPSQFPAGAEKMTTDGAETQLSEVMEPPPSRGIVSPRKVSPRKPGFQQAIVPSSVDAMDVVPDSEPMREQVQLSVDEEDKSMDVDRASARKTRGGWVTNKRGSDDSEVTEDSDILLPNKDMRREEEEEEEEGKEVWEKEQVVDVKEEVGKDEEKGEEDNDEDDEDDMPLSARLRRGRGRAPVASTQGKADSTVRTYMSKAKAEKKVTKTQSSGVFKKPDPPRQQKGRRTPNIVKSADMSHESIVPSSVPGQDHARPPRTRKPSLKAAAASKDKGKQPMRKTSRAASVTRSTRSHRSATVETEADRDVEMDEISDDERATEPMVDEEEEYMEPEVPQQNLKRKRGRPPKSRSLNQPAVTPRTRLNKRLKSAGSTISRTDATRVFALWSKNGLWYAGTVHEHLTGDTYNIKFQDGLETAVRTDCMRINSLRIGDKVRVGKQATDYKVLKVNHRTNKINVVVGGDEEEINMKDVGISTSTINKEWQDRTIDIRKIIPIIREVDAKPTPSPSRSATSFLSNSKGPRPLHKFLQKVGLIVSLSGNNSNDKTRDGRSRSDILSAVRDSGGVVVDDLFKYLKMDISRPPSRWVIQREKVEWVGEPKELQRLFLLADDCNLKPKYLMALALGIPCLSVNWLYSCLEVGKELDWRPHLLPQGRPTSLNVLPSQQIDLSWGNGVDQLIHIMTNPVAPRILDGQSVLCVGPDMTPKSKDTDKAGEAANYIIRIIMAMGAERVEAVRDISFASIMPSQYDLLIIREKDQYVRSYMHARTVDWNWVKDSLIMSRMLPYPSWPVEDDSQCSQSL